MQHILANRVIPLVNAFARNKLGSVPVLSRLLGRPVRWCRASIPEFLDERGVAAMEFALVLPILGFLLLESIQFGYAFFIQNNMTNAAREAVRASAVGSATIGGATSCPAASGTTEGIACGFLAELGGMTFTLAACDPDNPDATLCPGADDVTVRVTIPRSQLALADILGLFDSGTMDAQVTMRKEGS